MKKIILILLIQVTSPAFSDVIKCKLASGKIEYQSTPCSSTAVSQAKVEIKKMDPLQVEEAKNKLKAWQAEQAANEAAKIKADKELQEERNRQETINALNRNAIAQQQQAIAAQRQAEALERRNNSFIYNGPYFGPQYYPPQSYGMPYNSGQHPGHREGPHDDTSQGLPLNHLGITTLPDHQGQRPYLGISPAERH